MRSRMLVFEVAALIESKFARWLINVVVSWKLNIKIILFAHDLALEKNNSEAKAHFSIYNFCRIVEPVFIH